MNRFSLRTWAVEFPHRFPGPPGKKRRPTKERSPILPGQLWWCISSIIGCFPFGTTGSLTITTPEAIPAFTSIGWILSMMHLSLYICKTLQHGSIKPVLLFLGLNSLLIICSAALKLYSQASHGLCLEGSLDLFVHWIQSLHLSHADFHLWCLLHSHKSFVHLPWWHLAQSNKTKPLQLRLGSNHCVQQQPY